MRKKMIYIVLIVLTIVLVFAACNKDNKDKDNSSTNSHTENTTDREEIPDVDEVYVDPTENLKIHTSNDKYRNFYEIFIYSFCDSNDDGIGDINGLISKLDYLNDGDPNSGNDLGIDGIWLMPIMTSDTYHKYDVIDYYSIDPDYGTMEDFKTLLDECHKRGINVIIDLVFNHCSVDNQMFLDMCSQLRDGILDGNAEMFSIGKGDNVPENCYRIDGTDYFYEANFDPAMPEFNLSSEKAKKEFKKILEYWLDIGVDGFRLDAVKYYDGMVKECSDSTNGVEFLTWLCDTAKAIKPDVYFVGEVWDSSSKIKDFYESGIDSLFYFDGSGSSGKLISMLRGNAGTTVLGSMQRFFESVKKRNNDYINANFISNHDQARSAGYVAEDLTKEKMLASSYILLPGNPFIYYGEELGMTSKEDDPSKRTQMIWSKNDKVTIYPSNACYDNIPKNGGVKEQLEDKNSLLNFYRRLIKIRNQNPVIARGELDEVFNFNEPKITAYSIESDDEEILIVHNFSENEEKILDLSKVEIENAVLRGDLMAFDFEKNTDYNGAKFVKLNGNNLVLPPMSSAVIKISD